MLPGFMFPGICHRFFTKLTLGRNWSIAIFRVTTFWKHGCVFPIFDPKLHTKRTFFYKMIDRNSLSIGQKSLISKVMLHLKKKKTHQRFRMNERNGIEMIIQVGEPVSIDDLFMQPILTIICIFFHQFTSSN